MVDITTLVTLAFQSDALPSVQTCQVLFKGYLTLQLLVHLLIFGLTDFLAKMNRE